MPLVAIIIGSKTDKDYIEPALEVLVKFKISYDFCIISAHRNPEKLKQYIMNTKAKGIEVIIAAAGAAAHLPGIIASLNQDAIPVIGIPLPTSELKGIDSLYSIVQMPAGVPVACMGIGIAGAKNAALFAAQILGLKHPKIKQVYIKYKQELQQG